MLLGRGRRSQAPRWEPTDAVAHKAAIAHSPVLRLRPPPLLPASHGGLCSGARPHLPARVVAVWGACRSCGEIHLGGLRQEAEKLR